MALKVFIIDDHADYRALLRHHLEVQWPDCKITDYDPLAAGVLPDDFSGAGNDIVILGHPVADGEALEWLARFRSVPDFPPVLFIGDGEEVQIVRAMKIGAGDYISKGRLNHANFTEAVQGLLTPGNEASLPERLRVAEDELAQLVLPSLKGFTFVRRLSAGDIAAVYLMRNERSGQMMAVKVLRQVPDMDDGDAAFDRFLQEFEIIGRINHANIVKIFDLGVADDHAYIAMEYCSRGSLKRRIAEGLSADEAYDLLRQMALALKTIHSAGILHRDLKPTNVMFREDNTLALIDFGLAKQAHLRAELTGTGEIFGTPYYMSPEQGHGDDVDVRSDIYSLGIIFYEMLTGMKPFEGSSAMSVIVKHANADRPKLPEEFAQYQSLTDGMLAVDKEKRFQSVDDLLDWEIEAVSTSAD